VSGLWTPSSGDPAPEREPDTSSRPAGEPTAEEIAALRELHARLAATPVEDVIANHAIGILQIAFMHLGLTALPDDAGSRPAPNLAAAGLAIDAVAALVDGLGSRLGEYEADLRDALLQSQRLFVEVAEAAGDASAGEAGEPGAGAG
jgi:hypothetical protein